MIRKGIKIDTRDLNNAMGNLLRITKEDKFKLVETSGRIIAIDTRKRTDFATATKIEAELKEDVGGYTRAAAIVAARGRKTGQWPPGATFKDKVDYFIGARKSSARWLGAGFLPAIRAFGGDAPKFKKFINFPGSAVKPFRTWGKVRGSISHYDKGFIERHPTLLQDMTAKQTKFLERLAVRKLKQGIRKSRR